MSALTAWEHAQELGLDEDMLLEAGLALGQDIHSPTVEHAANSLIAAAEAVRLSKPTHKPRKLGPDGEWIEFETVEDLVRDSQEQWAREDDAAIRREGVKLA